MKKNKLELLIYKSFDSSLSREESELLQHELQNSMELRRIFNQISEIRRAAGKSAESSFSPFFEERVLNRIKNLQTQNGYLSSFADSLNFSFRKIALTASFILAVLVSYNLISGNSYSIESVLGTNKTPVENSFDSNLIWSRM